MAARVDELLSVNWRAAGVRPSPASADAEFFRRASLDLTGVIPRVAEVRRFLNDKSPNKRETAISKLLESPRHVTHLANTWRELLLPGGVGGQQLDNVIGVQNWLRRYFARNMRYDRMVADLLVASGGGQEGPALFFTANDLAPEKLASATSRIFLGLQIECAQCHDHPFDHWKQKDFWGYAAFFAQVRRASTGSVALEDATDGEVTIPETETVVAPLYPGGKAAKIGPGGNRRVQLAIWMASRDNPYLARATVNRIWAHLFGYGLVEPVDDIGPHNRPSHPQLFEELAAYFVETGFDLRELYRTLTISEAYQRSSRSKADNGGRMLATMTVKPLSSEQFYDSLLRVLSPQRAAGTANMNGGLDARRQAFIARLGKQRHAAEYEAGVPQALTMMNGVDMAEATSLAGGGILQALKAPFLSTEDKVEILFLATLSRMPKERESAACVKLLKDAKSADEGLGDVIWALLNSVEFAMNH